jgi:hypothetical protein
MDFAIELPADDHAAALQVLSQIAEWHCPPGRKYQTAEATRLDHPLLAGCARAFFIKMTPGSCVHRHRDPPGVVDFYDTDHIVVSTNNRAFICWEDAGRERSVHLDLGKRYRIVDRGVLHWAVNEGDTDRIHLLIEYPKPPPGSTGVSITAAG